MASRPRPESYQESESETGPYSAGLPALDRRWGALIKSVAAGDEPSVAALYDETSPLLFGLVTHILGDAEASEETLIEVYTCLWRQAASYDENSYRPFTWLVSVARKCAVDKLRLRDEHRGWDARRDALEDITSNVGRPAESLPAQAVGRRARSALEALPSRQRQALELAYFAGLGYREISSRLGMPPGEVTTLLRAGMETLLDQLKPERQSE
ncbi:MAG: sigma-70 family RNA polymerase sigma factor [Acidobacteria bacterium]|nr:sigma-70 family RNA polymerase sigma factor [Acidobacteriota bacterium]